MHHENYEAGVDLRSYIMNLVEHQIFLAVLLYESCGAEKDIISSTVPNRRRIGRVNVVCM